MIPPNPPPVLWKRLPAEGDSEPIIDAEGNLVAGVVVADEKGQNNAQSITAVPGFIELTKHILAMHDDDYLIGHPEWHEIVAEARAIQTHVGFTL